MIGLSVVIPAFNEEKRLATSLPAIVEYLDKRGSHYEVVVVDDGSSDGTADLAASWEERGVRVVRQPRNRGKGAALKAGVLASRGAVVLLTDADLSTPIGELERLEEYLDENPVVFGSRAVEGARIDDPQPFFRQCMGKTFNFMIRVLVVGGVRDTQCGFKLLRGDDARRLFADLTLDGFSYDVELLWLARRYGLAVAEVGVLWNHCPDSTVHLLADPLRMAFDVLRFRFHHLRRGPQA